MNIPQLLQRVAACGYAISLRGGSPVLEPTRSEHIMPEPLLGAVKRSKAEIVAYLSTCCVCGRDTSDDDDRERMDDPAHCDRGGSQAVTDGNGVYHPETQRCPFKR